MMHRLKLQFQVAVAATVDVLSGGKAVLGAISLFVFIVSFLQWLFQFEVFIDVLRTDALNFGQRVDTFFDAFIALFRYGNDITPISFILIAAFQAISLVIFLELRSISKLKPAGMSALGFGLIGSGCVACSGSLLTPLLGLVAAEFSVAAAERIGDGVLLIAVILSVRAWLQMGNAYAFTVKTLEK